MFLNFYNHWLTVVFLFPHVTFLFLLCLTLFLLQKTGQPWWWSYAHFCHPRLIETSESLIPYGGIVVGWIGQCKGGDVLFSLQPSFLVFAVSTEPVGHYLLFCWMSTLDSKENMVDCCIFLLLSVDNMVGCCIFLLLWLGRLGLVMRLSLGTVCVGFTWWAARCCIDGCWSSHYRRWVPRAQCQPQCLPPLS